MLDAMETRANVLRRDIERRREVFADSGETFHHARAVERKPRHAHCVAELGAEAGPRIARHGDVIHFSQLHAGLIEAELNRASRKPGGVLDAVEALLFDRGDQAAVHHDRGGSVGVIGVDSQNDHERAMSALILRHEDTTAAACGDPGCSHGSA